MPDSVDSFFDSLKPGESATYGTGGYAAQPEYAAQPPQSDEDTYTDLMNSLASGTHGLGAAAFAGAAHLSPHSRNYWMQQAQDQRDLAGDDIETMTPAARRSLDAPVTSSDFWHHPLRALTLKGLQMAPAAGAVVGAGAVGGPWAGAAAGYAVTAGQALSDFAQNVQDAPDTELRKNPEYDDYRQTHSEADTKAWWTEQRASESWLATKAGVSGAAFGALGPGATWAKGALGAAGKSAWAGAGIGGAEAFGGQFIQDLGSRLAIQQAQGGVGPQEDFGTMVGESAAGAAPWALFGAGAGGIHAWREGQTDAAGTRAAPPARPPVSLRPDWDQFGRYGEGLGGYRGRPSDVPPGQTPSPEVDANKRASAQARHEEPVSGRNVSIEGTGRMGLKPDAETMPAADTARDESVSTVSSPVADDQNVALEATQGNWMADRWRMIRDIKAANPDDTRSHSDFLKMNRADLTAEHSKLPAVKEPEAAPAEQAPAVQPPAQPAAAPAPARPDVTANLPVGGDVTPAGDFATGPVGEAGSMLPPDRDVERELARYDELQQAQQGAQPQPEVRPTVEPKPAVEPKLQAVKPEVIGEGLAEAVQSRERIAAAQAAEEAALREKEGVGGKKWTKAQIAFRQANNKVADEIVSRHQLTKDSKDWLASDPSKAGGRGSLAAMISRLRGMVEDADAQRKAGRFTPPKEFNWIDHPKMPNHSPSVLAIEEARRFLKRVVGYRDARGREVVGLRKEDYPEISAHLTREFGLTGSHLSEKEKEVNYRKALPERVSEAEEQLAKQEIGPRAGVRALEEGEEERIAAPEKEKEEEVAAEPEGQAKARETIQKLLEPIPKHPTAEDATREDWFKWKQAVLSHTLAEHVMKSPRVAEEGLKPQGLTPWSDKMLKFETYMRQFQDATRERAAKLPAVKEEPKAAPDVDKPIRVMWTGKQTGHGQWPERIVRVATEEEARKLVEGPIPAGFTRVSADKLLTPDATRWTPIVARERGKEAPAAKLQAGLEARLPKMKETAEGAPARMNDGNLGYVKPWKSGVIKDWLSKVKGENPPELKGLAPALLNKIIDAVGDMPTHLLKDGEMRKIGPTDTRGKYDSDLERIYINTDKAGPTTVFHEAFHAATVKGILADDELKDHLYQLWKEANPNVLPLADWQRTRATVEWLTDLMTDKNLQERYKNVKISPELAKTLGIAPWRKKTMFEGVLNVIRKALGFGPRDTGVIEAALALSERAMERTELATKGTEPKAFYQRDIDTPEKTQEAFLKSPTEKFKTIKDIEAKVAVQHAKDVALNVGTGFIKGTAKALNMDKLDLIHGKVAPFIRPIGQIMNKIHAKYLERREGDKDIRLRAYMLDRTHANESDTYDQLTRMMKQFQIDPTGGTAKAGSIRAYYAPKVQELYNQLSPENKTRAISEMKYYQELRKESGERALKDLIDTYGPPDGSTASSLMTRAKANELTKEDREHFEQQGIGEKVRSAMEQMRGTEIYSNTLRNGNWVMHGRFDMPKGGNDVDAAGTKLADDMREFDTEEEANQYATEGNPYGLHPTVRSAYYGNDPETGNYIRMTKEDAEQVAPAGQKPDQKFQVKLERDYTEMAKSPAEARRLREEMIKAGVNESTLTQPLDKRREQTWAHISPADQRLMEQRINKLNVSDVEKQRMIQASREAMLASQAGGLLGKHKIQRRNVFGGDSGSAEGLDAYSRMHHHAMAKAEVAPELNDAIDRMDTHEKANQTTPDATRRSIINNEVRERLLSQQPMNTKSSWLIRNLMNYSFLNFLLRPSHVFLQQMHPWIYSVPELLARHGWAAIGGQTQAMRDLSGYQSMARLKMLAKGGKAAIDLARALREKDIDKAVQLAHGWNPIKEMIDNLKDADERDALTKMLESGHLHSAFDTSILEGNGFDRQQAMLQQITQTMEATNRLSVALNAYRLEKAMHGDHANAIDYAQRRIESSMGVYTPTNIAPIFRNPLMKPVMQFHQMPINLAISLYNNMYKALPEKLGGQANWEARKTLAYQLGTAFAFGGMGGMPMDIPKVAGLASQALGGPAPSEYDNKFRETLNDMVGPTMANVIEEGLPSLAGPFGPALGHRMGFNSELLFGEPASGSSADIGSWIASNLAGASASTISGWHNTLLSLEAGEYEKAAEDVLPGSARDLFKAYREATQGTFAGPRQIKEASVAQGLMQAMGFQTLEQERAYEGHMALQKEIRAEKTDRSGVLQKGTIGDVMRWNALHPTDRITPTEMRRARQPQPGQQVLGVKVPKWIPPARAKEYQQMYGS